MSGPGAIMARNTAATYRASRWPFMPGPSLPLPQVPVAPDAAQQAQHLVGEPVEPVSRKAEDPLRLRALRTAKRARRMPRFAGPPDIGVTVHREAKDPVPLFAIAGHGSTFCPGQARVSTASAARFSRADSAALGAASVTSSFSPIAQPGIAAAIARTSG
jgi:hypothetical protein